MSLKIVVGKGEFVFSWPCLSIPSTSAKPKSRRATRSMVANMTTDLKFQGKKHFGKEDSQQLGSPLSEKMQYEFILPRSPHRVTNENPDYSGAHMICRLQNCCFFCRTALLSIRDSIFLVYTHILVGHICCLQSLQWWGLNLPVMNQQIPCIGEKKGEEKLFS